MFKRKLIEKIAYIFGVSNNEILANVVEWYNLQKNMHMAIHFSISHLTLNIYKRELNHSIAYKE